ncbi:MAG: hypothetical protein EXS37_14075 [Opitutus sp.]|nr:hypothetical protein [Opitutus sp.]
MSKTAAPVCLDCAAREPGATARIGPPTSDYDDHRWAPGLRTYIVFSSGWTNDSYDQRDHRSFEQKRDDNFDDKPAPDGSFLDS